MADHKRKFKGIWVPAKVWFNKELPLLKKMLMTEIDSLDASPKGCFKSNKKFGEMFHVTPKYISEVINDLVEEGFLKSTIDKAAGNRRYLKPLSRWNRIGYPTGDGEGIPPQPETPIPPQSDCSNNTNTNNTGRKTINNELERSLEQNLALDLKIVEERKFFTTEISRIFRHFSKGEKVTFGRITKYLVGEVQAGRQEIGVFKDAVEWARWAMASEATNKKGLFVAKIQKETGFKKQEKIL